MTYKNALKSIIIFLFAIFIFSSCKNTAGITLIEKGNGSYSIPYVSGLPESSPANRVLEEFFSGINEELKILNNNGNLLGLHFLLEEGEDRYIINSWLEDKTGHKLYIPSIEIIGTSVSVPDSDFIENISNRAVMDALLFLTKSGCDIELYSLNAGLSTGLLCELITVWYEGTVGSPINISGISRQKIDTESILKTIAINPDFPANFDVEQQLKATQLIDMIAKILPRLFFDNYALSSQFFSFGELINMLSFYHSLYSSLFENDSENGNLWVDFGKSIIDLENIEEFIDPDGEGLSRAEIADCFSIIHKEYFYNEDIPLDLSDSKDKDDIYCASQGIMSFFPKHDMFSPEYTARYYQISDISYKFISTAYESCKNENTDKLLRLSDGLAFLQSIDELCGDMENFGHEKQNPRNTYRVVNDRKYDWYLRQYETGEYASVNCMPTMTAMAIRWVNEHSTITPEDLRNLYLEENNTGWWLFQVMKALNANDVEYNYANANKQSIIESIDRGNIVLAMISEARPKELGHCEIIYGYIKNGDAVQFLVYDPGFSDTLKADGSPYGKGRQLDSDYVVFTMNRINHIFIEVFADQDTQGFDLESVSEYYENMQNE